MGRDALEERRGGGGVGRTPPPPLVPPTPAAKAPEQIFSFNPLAPTGQKKMLPQTVEGEEGGGSEGGGGGVSCYGCEPF